MTCGGIVLLLILRSGILRITRLILADFLRRNQVERPGFFVMRMNHKGTEDTKERKEKTENVIIAEGMLSYSQILENLRLGVLIDFLVHFISPIVLIFLEGG